MSEYVDVIIRYSQVSADVIFDYDIGTLKFKRPYNLMLSITIISAIYQYSNNTLLGFNHLHMI